MTVVKKATNPGSVVSKRTASTSVTSQLQRTKLSDMTDASFGTLDASSDGKFISYDEDINKFILLAPVPELADESVSIKGPLYEFPVFLLTTIEAVYPEDNGFE